MKLLHLLFISLTYETVCSVKCNSNSTVKLKCLQLCCKFTHFYVYEHQHCKQIPDGKFKALWYVQLYDNEKLAFIEYQQCELSKDPYASIPLCYSPHYFKNSDQVGLLKFYDVSCQPWQSVYEIDKVTVGLHYNSYKTFLGRYMSLGLICLYVMLICLPIMTVYTCRKGLQTNVLLHLVTWYFISMTAFLLTTVYPMVFREGLPMKIYGTLNAYGDLRCFFCVAACLWLNIIGLQIWSEYRRANAVPNKRQDRIRLACYFLYDWGISAMLTYIHKVSEDTKGSENIANWIMLAITCFNILTFVILSSHICLTRCKVVHLSNEANLKRHLVRLIIRLGLLMGFPRMLIMFLSFFVYFDYSLCMYFCIPEPFVIFTVLVWRPSAAVVMKKRKPQSIPSRMLKMSISDMILKVANKL